MLQPSVTLEGYTPFLQGWLDYFTSHDPSRLSEMLDDDVVFHSPVVFTPQRGKPITLAYLTAAGKTLGSDDFRYVRIFDSGHRAVLEFETMINGKYIDGIDMIEWNDAGLITDFKVMVRPLQAVQTVHAAMGAMLAKMKG